MIQIGLTDNELIQAQQADSDIVKLTKTIDKQPSYQMCGDLLYVKPCERFDNPRFMVPSSMRKKILKMHHDCELAAHVGRDKTFDSICKRFYWPSMYRDVQRYVNACVTCIKHKGNKPKKHGLLLPITALYPDPAKVESINMIKEL